MAHAKFKSPSHRLLEVIFSSMQYLGIGQTRTLFNMRADAFVYALCRVSSTNHYESSRPESTILYHNCIRNGESKRLSKFLFIVLPQVLAGLHIWLRSRTRRAICSEILLSSRFPG